MYVSIKDDNGHTHWPVEVFRHDGVPVTQDYESMPAGWYWWTCFPGCLPEGDPHGPFKSRVAAAADAEEWLND